jgi:hypothetical protein
MGDLSAGDAEDDHLVDLGEPPGGRDAEDGLAECAAVGYVRGDAVAFGDQAQQVERPVGEGLGLLFGDGARSGRVARHGRAADVQHGAVPHQVAESAEVAVVPGRDERAYQVLVRFEDGGHELLLVPVTLSQHGGASRERSS